jgi:16S rRNA processing protein RimM
LLARQGPGSTAACCSKLPSSDASGDGFVRIGRVGRPHGLDGSFVVEAASEEPARFAVDAVLWVGGGPARVVSSKRARGLPVIRLDRAVERGAELTVRVSELPPPADDSYYVFQLAGLEVEEEGGRVLGRVEDVAPGVANDVLELDSGIVLPMHEDCIRKVDLAAGRIVVARGFADDDYPR